MMTVHKKNWRSRARREVSRFGAALARDSRPRILMYHRVWPSDHRLAVTPELFRRHLDLLNDLGKEVLSVSDLLDRRDEENLDAVALTFDDGYAEMASVAEELTRRGFGATFYVLPRFADRGHQISPEACFSDGGDRFLSRGIIRELHTGGFEMASHGLTHRSFTELDTDESLAEIRASRMELADLLGAEVRGLAYPRGHHGALHKAQARAAGYRHAVSVQPGPLVRRSDIWALPRTEVAGGDDEQILAAKLSGGMDLWHRALQNTRSLKTALTGR